MIKLHENSQKYVKETYGRYKEHDFTDGMVLKSPVIHLHPVADTVDADGNEWGCRRDNNDCNEGSPSVRGI